MIPIAVQQANPSSFPAVRSKTKHSASYENTIFLSDDVESQLSSTHAQDEESWNGNRHGATSPITYRTPTRPTRTKRHRRGSPSPLSTRKAKAKTRPSSLSSSSIFPRELPLGTTGKKISSRQLQTNTTIDSAEPPQESMHSSCQLYPEPEIATAMKKRVMIDERQNIRVSPTHTAITCATMPPAISSPGRSPKSILKRSLRFAAGPNNNIDKKHHSVVAISTPLRRSRMKRGGSTAFVEPIHYEGDILDYIFDNVESFLCPADNYESRDDRTNNINTGLADDSRNGNCHDQLERLYKVPSLDKEDIAHGGERQDALDYIFECGGNDNDVPDQELRIRPTPAEDRDLLDYMFECDGDESMVLADTRDASYRAPQSPHRRRSAPPIKTANREANHIIVTASSSSSNDSYRIGRAEILRQKKRQIEEKRRQLVIRGGETRYYVPKGYKDDTMIISQVSSDAITVNQAQLEQEQSRRVVRVFMVVLVMTLVGVALVVIAIMFFFPLRA